ncbi:MAG: DAK2 domain-containing protein [Ruminococcaceae bacterium]|nr:DAK2 domain-containing protein [Oscillospiraceae bacterium]
MMLSAANHLSNQRQEVDNLNVFPVPDGDTGTNMSLTMRAAAAELPGVRDKGVGSVTKALANATLRGARGNSGVIFSQLMRGLYKALKEKNVCDASDLAKAFRAASDNAYRAVMKPTEGTILTVARALAEAAEKYAPEVEDMEQLLTLVVDEGNKALDYTPEQLPALKQAGVVDAGGKGLMCVVEGALHTLRTGEIIQKNEQDEAPAPVMQKSVEAADIKFRYCTEFLINKARKDVNVPPFKATIGKYGDSMVVVDDEEIIKVHIHTNEPNLVIGEALKLGELTNIKIDNMKIQHENRIIDAPAKQEEESEIPQEMKKYGFISVAVGDGIVQLFRDLGVDTIIEGGQTMNPSTEDILNAVEALHAENVFIFPNNKNVILSAEQAANLTKKKVTVIPTRSVAQAMTCMLCYDEDMEPEELAGEMNEAMAGVKTGQVTYAVRDTSFEDKTIKEGDILGLVGGKIEIVNDDVRSNLEQIAAQMVDEDTSVITLFYGSEVTEEDAKVVAQALEESYPECDVLLHCGGQPIYYYIISAE